MAPFSKKAAAIAVLITCAVSALADDRFIELKPSRPDIYHAGWIDHNKNGEKDIYEDPSVDIEDRITDLLSKMTIDEKTVQMVTLYGYPRVLMDELPNANWKKALWKDGIGNIDEHMNGNEGSDVAPLPVPHNSKPWSLHAKALNEVQRFFIEETRMGIPADFTNEGIRGIMHTGATSFPAQLGVASAFDRKLVQDIGRVTGQEARALGYTNVYSPILDLARDPRWGRTTETYGEDPFLAGELGYEQVSALQKEKVAATPKHFAIYSVPKGGRDGDGRTDPQVSWRDANTIFLHPFRRAIKDAGALGVMASYNDYDGIPVIADSRFLTDILRKDWGFKGYVVSDSAAVEFVHDKHRVASTMSDGIRQCIEAGLNVRTNFTAPEEFVVPLRELIASGKLSMRIIDARVRDILRVKYLLGLFDRPYVEDPQAADRVVRSLANMEVAARAAHESIVLLKNQSHALPLRKDLKRILVTGPLADNPAGWWSRYGPQHLEFVTPLQGIRQKLGPMVAVEYVQGCAVKDAKFPASDVLKEEMPAAVQLGIAAAASAAKQSDVVIAVLGETEEISRESASRVSLNLPGYQEDLLKALYASGTPVVLVLSNGRPLSVNWAAQNIPAILEMWFPGDMGGAALADVLFGDYNPSGRLPITFPKSAGHIPYNFPAHPGSQNRDPGQIDGLLFPFGHGLSYTSFAYSNLSITPNVGPPNQIFEVSCEVTNTGDRPGEEVVQLYLRDDYSSVITFEKTLRGFERVTLNVGESKTVRFRLLPEHLALFDRNQNWTIEPGDFTVFVGASSEDIRLKKGFSVSGGMVLGSSAATQSTTKPSDQNYAPRLNYQTSYKDYLELKKGRKSELIFIGDSITEQWRWGAGAAVWKKHFEDRALNFGLGSDKTQHTLWRLENIDVRQFEPKVAVILIGTNNTGDTPEAIAAGVKAVVSRTRSTFSDIKVILVSILPNARATARMADANKLMSSIADGREVVYLDLASKFTPEGDNWKGLSPDRLHLTAAGYEMWATELEAMLPELERSK